jgi:DNA-binding LytR/AlgR family response regulator
LARGKHSEGEKNFFVIIKKNGIEKVKLDDILYFESQGRKINLHTKEKRISFNGSIDKIQKKLDKRFVFCHGSYIINLTKIEKFQSYTVIMEGGARLPVSQRKNSETKQSFLAYLIKHFPCNFESDVV